MGSNATHLVDQTNTGGKTMKTVDTLLGAAALAAVFASPAAAEYVRFGSVDVGYRTDMDTAYTEFGGRLESLRLIASRSDIFCRSVVVRYENGERQNVFSGRLDERRPVDVDLRGRARKVDSIRFACRSDEFRGGRVYIEGEVGNYRDEWRRDRNWERRWSNLFGGMMGGPGDMRGPGGMRGPGDMRRPGDMRGPGGPGGMRGPGGPMGDWSVLGTMSFEGRNDKESNFTGWAGRRVERIGLRPIETDARCMSIVATFANGRKVKLADGRPLERGRVTVYDLPGRDSDITKLYMRCRSLEGYRVTIEVLLRR
jgi:hypothetical protein